MDIPGKLREDLKRIYGDADPLNYIEDIMVKAVDLRGEEKILTVNLRVPARWEKYMASTSFGRITPEMMDALMYGNWNVPQREQPEVKLDPMMASDFFKPEKIIYSGPKTIVFWRDGTKTVVSLGEGQEHDEYTAYCAAVAKKMFGATHKVKKFIDSVAVRPKPKAKKDKYEQMEMIPMPGTEDPNWGQKHWAPETLEEDTCNG